MVVDAIVVALFVALVVRGWLRGLVREAIDVATLVLGAVVAFRFAATMGTLLAGMTGIGSDTARIIGGAVLFLAISIGAGIAGSMIHRSLRVLPGLTLLNRLGGAALGAVYTLVLATIALTLIAALPTPAPVAGQLRDSVAVQRLTGPEGPAQRMLSAAAGDRVMSSLAWLQGFVGGWSVESSEAAPVELPQIANPRLVHPSSAAAGKVYDALNNERSAAGLGALAWSDDLALVAVNRAGAAYATGSSEATTPLSERLAALGLSTDASEEALVLAASPDGVRRAVVASTGHRSTLLSPDYRHVGVGVVDGPYGLMAVQVYSG